MLLLWRILHQRYILLLLFFYKYAQGNRTCLIYDKKNIIFPLISLEDRQSSQHSLSLQLLSIASCRSSQIDPTWGTH
jgi:hypothetical protein